MPRPRSELVAIVVDHGGPLVAGLRGWFNAPDHFAERHGLVMLVALGESMIAIGVGVGHDLDFPPPDRRICRVDGLQPSRTHDPADRRTGDRQHDLRRRRRYEALARRDARLWLRHPEAA
jgi:hypothetical protein